MISIRTKTNIGGRIRVPGSKSYTHRILIASALSDGNCEVKNALKSEDTLLTAKALQQMGVSINDRPWGFEVMGSSGKLTPAGSPVYLGNSGTSMRLLLTVAALCDGICELTGSRRMCERPVGELLDAMNQLGINAVSINNNGCPPVRIKSKGISGGHVHLDCSKSSQYLSALLLVAPCTRDGIEIQTISEPVSKPYIDMTVDIMENFGIQVRRDGYSRFRISGLQTYQAGEYTVEPDCSNASYFWAAAAVTGSTITVRGLSRKTRQGDIRLLDRLEAMGCTVVEEKNGISVTGADLNAIETDMGDLPDMVPTLAVVAAFARGTTIIRNVAHLRVKESDRLAAVTRELSKMGINAECTASDLIIRGGKPEGAEIETYDDHRIAMSFAVTGLVVPGVTICGETCVEKSFPDFWQVFSGLYSDE